LEIVLILIGIEILFVFGTFSHWTATGIKNFSQLMGKAGIMYTAYVNFRILLVYIHHQVTCLGGQCAGTRLYNLLSTRVEPQDSINTTAKAYPQ
jgi:hypothetical protein